MTYTVSIHATLAGGDFSASVSVISCGLFLSTPPSRVATEVVVEGVVQRSVSIHATLAGGDPMIFV